MGLLNFISSKHSSVNRNYMSRVCDEEMPKHKASSLAKKWDLEYWDGDRRTGMVVTNLLRGTGQN
jgi:protein-L-isoaspartate(D-aspartate) O-methyltransferase